MKVISKSKKDNKDYYLVQPRSKCELENYHNNADKKKYYEKGVTAVFLKILEKLLGC